MRAIIPNMLGSYGPWARDIIALEDLPLSFLHSSWSDKEEWKHTARKQVLQLLAQPNIGKTRHFQVYSTN